MRRIPSLDGLRAVSIVLVIAGHWCLRAYKSDVAASYASLGVRIFFVISGYLITTLLIKEREETNTIHLQRFYVRRAYRIFPAAAFFMTVTFVVFWRELKWYDIAAAALYLTNYNPTPPWMLGHLWSLGVEEQFYFLWPTVLKKWYGHRTRILFSVILVAPIYSVVAYSLKVPGVWRTFPAVADNLAVGCLLAILSEKIPLPSVKQFAIAVTTIALVPIVVASTRWRTLTQLFLLWPLLYLSIAIVVMYVVRKPPLVLNCQPVAWLGRISYSVYLWQQLFSLTPRPHPWYWMIFPVLAGSASYYAIEQPALRLRELRRGSHSRVQPTYSLATGD